MEKNNKINQVIKTIFENIENQINVKTIIGEKIIIGDDTIIPVIDVSILYLLGGGEYGKKTILNKEPFPFSVANGTNVNLKPCAFLIKTKNEDYQLINIGSNTYEKIIYEITNYIKDCKKQ